MSGYVSALSPCLVCGRAFFYNPHRVPSYSPTGDPRQREPICEHCIQVVNAQRRERGLPEWPIYPDSYEAIPEEEL